MIEYVCAVQPNPKHKRTAVDRIKARGCPVNRRRGVCGVGGVAELRYEPITATLKQPARTYSSRGAGHVSKQPGDAPHTGNFVISQHLRGLDEIGKQHRKPFYTKRDIVTSMHAPCGPLLRLTC